MTNDQTIETEDVATAPSVDGTLDERLLAVAEADLRMMQTRNRQQRLFDNEFDNSFDNGFDNS